MAKELIEGKIAIDDSDLVSVDEQLTSIEKSIRNVNKADALIEAEKSFAAINKIVDETALSVQDMGKAIENYKNIAAVAGRESPIGKAALEQAAQLQDRVDGLTKDISNLANDGRKLQSALQLGSTVVAGYQGFQSVTALLGVENEELLETITKLQAAQGALQAIETIRLNLEKESFLVTQAKTTATKAYTAVQWALNAAFAASPIGLVVVALTALGAGIAFLLDKLGIFSGAWDAISEAVGKAWEFIKNVTSAIFDAGAALVDFIQHSKAARIALGILTLGASEWGFAIKGVVDSYINQISVTEKLLEANRKLNKERIEQLIKEIEEIEKAQAASKTRFDAELNAIEFEMAKRQAAGLDYAEQERKKLELTIKRTQEELRLEIEKYEKLKKLAEQDVTLASFRDKAKIANARNNAKESEELQKELSDNIRDSEQALTVFEIGENKKRADDFKTKQDEKLAKEKEIADKRKELVRATEDLIAANIEDANERAITQLQIKHERERQELIDKYGKETDLIGELERKQAEERNQLLDDILEQDQAAQKERDEKKLEEERQLAESRYNALVEANKKLEDEDKRHAEQKKVIEEALFNVAQSSIDGISALGEIAIKDQQRLAKFNAGITAAQMFLDTAKSISSVIAGATAAAAAGGPAAPFLIAGYIASGVATVLANFKTAINAFRQAKVGSAPPELSAASAGGAGGQPPNAGRGENGQTFTGSEPQNTQNQFQVVVLDSELHQTRQQQETLVEQSTL